MFLCEKVAMEKAFMYKQVVKNNKLQKSLKKGLTGKLELCYYNQAVSEDEDLSVELKKLSK